MDNDEDLACLLAEARHGNNQALGSLLAMLRPWVRRQAQGLLGQRLATRLDGSDIVQEVHLRAFERFDQFQGDSVRELRAWVQTILRHIVTDCRRRHGAGGRDVHVEVDGRDLIPRQPADVTTPSQVAIHNEDQARLSEALRQLPERQRRVFQLRFYEGLSFEEVAREVGVTVGNARVLMVRATERLRKELGDEHD